MRDIVIETQYLPPIYAVAQFYHYKNIWWEYFENYQKKSFRNKCEIAGANGRLLLSVPLIGGRNHRTPIRSVQIDNSKQWARDHLHSISSAYGKSPYFLYYFEKIKNIINKEHVFLWQLNSDLMDLIFKLLNLDREIQRTGHWVRKYVNKSDLRHHILPSNSIDFKIPTYNQCFSYKYPFLNNLSVIDLLFNKGPESVLILAGVKPYE